MKNGLHFRYWILPLLVLTPLIIFYFSDIEWAREIVCPSVNPELGIVETIQLILLFLIFIICVIAVKKKQDRTEKIIFFMLSIFSLFVFLEEIDYGRHWVLYFKGHEHTLFRDLTGKRNIHNLGNNAKLFKRSIYPFMGLLFILAPLFLNRIKNPILRYLTPSKWFIITAIITVFSYVVPRLLVDLHIFEDGGFGWNIGEFSEIMVYYIFFLYLYEIIFDKSISGSKK
jgi:hypothetical protein